MEVWCLKSKCTFTEVNGNPLRAMLGLMMVEMTRLSNALKRRHATAVRVCCICAGQQMSIPHGRRLTGPTSNWSRWTQWVKVSPSPVAQPLRNKPSVMLVSHPESLSQHKNRGVVGKGKGTWRSWTRESSRCLCISINRNKLYYVHVWKYHHETITLCNTHMLLKTLKETTRSSALNKGVLGTGHVIKWKSASVPHTSPSALLLAL